MAERRMFAKTIIDSDAFLDMPLSAQSLYFHLSMRADDEGFINNPKKIQRMVGCNDDDLKLLLTKRFIIVFDSGVIVIKHWKIHNYIRRDRVKETLYQEEKSELTEKENGTYRLIAEDQRLKDVSDTCQPTDNQVSTKCPHRLGKDRIGKVSLGEVSIGKDSAVEDREEPAPAESKNAYQIYQECFGMLNSINQQDLSFWIEDLSEEMVIEAMKKAVLNGKPYSYAKGIMKQWSNKGIKTVEDAKAEEVQFSNNRFKKKPVRKEVLPKWAEESTKYPEKKMMTPEEIEEWIYSDD